MRETSRIAFETLMLSGKLSKRRAQALGLLLEYGPATAGELGKHTHITGLWKRYSELQRLGYAKEVAVRECTVTGYSAIVWEACLQLQQGDLF